MVKKKKLIKKKQKNPLDNQVMIVFGAIIFFLIGLIATPYLYHQIFEKFEYAGINFEKTKFEKITFYKGVFPVIYQGKFVQYYNMYLRTDPRKNEIPINTNFTISENVTISLDPEATFCKSAILGQSLIGQFFNAFPWVKEINIASTDFEISRAQNWSHITCNSSEKDHTIFIIQKSETPSIERGEKENCYVINVGECQYIETVERIVVGAIAQINGIRLS